MDTDIVDAIWDRLMEHTYQHWNINRVEDAKFTQYHNSGMSEIEFDYVEEDETYHVNITINITREQD